MTKLVQASTIACSLSAMLEQHGSTRSSRSTKSNVSSRIETSQVEFGHTQVFCVSSFSESVNGGQMPDTRRSVLRPRLLALHTHLFINRRHHYQVNPASLPAVDSYTSPSGCQTYAPILCNALSNVS